MVEIEVQRIMYRLLMVGTIKEGVGMVSFRLHPVNTKHYFTVCFSGKEAGVEVGKDEGKFRYSIYISVSDAVSTGLVKEYFHRKQLTSVQVAKYCFSERIHRT